MSEAITLGQIETVVGFALDKKTAYENAAKLLPEGAEIVKSQGIDVMGVLVVVLVYVRPA